MKCSLTLIGNKLGSMFDIGEKNEGPRKNLCGKHLHGDAPR